MIKAFATTPDGGKLIVLGLSERNVELLKPIPIDLSGMGVDGVHVLLVYGVTEAAIARDLAQFITAETEVRGTIPKDD